MSNVPRTQLIATYQKSESWGSRNAPSQLVHTLRQLDWVPQGEVGFVKPASASQELLPEGFAFDPGWVWIKEIQFGTEVARQSEEHRQKQEIAKELGFADISALNRAKRFAQLPRDEQERFFADLERRNADLPERESRNPERRTERVRAEAEEAPDRLTEERTRSVSVGREKVKEEAAAYLRQQYASDGEMICQACSAPLPFKLDDGTPFFEKVEFLNDLGKRYYQNYIALCPNHAAMFQHANGSIDELRDRLVEREPNRMDIVLARNEVSIYFTKTHWSDLKAVVDVDVDNAS